MTVTEQIVSIAPADGRVLGTVELSSPAEVASAIGRARDAQGDWAARGPVNRAGRLVELGRLIGEAAPGLSELVAEEVGKPIVEARGEVARGAQICAYYGGVAYELGGTARRSIDPQVMLLSRQVPVGVAGVITPWNFPVAIPAWKIVPALAAGCSVVWKPAPEAALSALRLFELARDAGIPEDVLALVHGDAETGGALVDGEIDALSFTGSTAVGRTLQRRAGGRGLRLTVELGGVNVAHVLADADVVRAATDVANAAFGYAGQKCTATQVVAVASELADDFAATLGMQTSGVKVGDPLDASTVCGPVIDEDTASRLNQAIDSLSAEYRVLARGQTPEGPAFVPPVLFRDEERTSSLLREELFGPVCVLTSTRSLSDHAEIAAASGAGLAAAVYGRDADAIRRVLNIVGTGVVGVNRPSTGLDPHVPFGGWGSSGGSFSEQGLEGLRFYLKWQTVYWRGEGEGVAFP